MNFIISCSYKSIFISSNKNLFPREPIYKQEAAEVVFIKHPPSTSLCLDYSSILKLILQPTAYYRVYSLSGDKLPLIN